MTAKYRKKPVVIEAIRYQPGPGGNCDTIRAFMGLGAGACYCDHASTWTIPTLEGEMEASPGDYIIRGVKGEFYPCKSDIFEATYEAVGE